MSQCKPIHLALLALVPLIALFRSSECSTDLFRVKLNKYNSKEGGVFEQPVLTKFSRFAQDFYYTNVKVGSPAKQFKLLIDINSRETWIPHYTTPGYRFKRLNFENGYSSEDSSSSIKEHKEYTITYCHTKLQGELYRDLFEFQDLLNTNISTKYLQRFLAISSASCSRFHQKYDDVDGLLALSPSNLSATNSEQPILALNKANLTGSTKFSLQFNPTPNDNIQGEIAFGQLEQSGQYLGPLTYHPVIDEHQWVVSVQRVMLGGYVLPSWEGDWTARVSSTQNHHHGPSHTVFEILKLLDVEFKEHEFEPRFYNINCLRIVDAPTLTFVIDSKHYKLEPTTYIRKDIEASTCYVDIISNDSENSWTLGTNFLQNYYNIFDVSARKLAFATRS